jgi:hypothetical protein
LHGYIEASAKSRRPTGRESPDGRGEGTAA